MLASILLGLLLALLATLPLAWKWQLGIARVTLFVVVVGLISGFLIGLLGGAVLNPAASSVLIATITVLCAFGILAYRFYRDPERTAPEGEGIIVSPAEGEVIYVREFRRGILPASKKYGREFALEELTRTALRHRDAVVVGIAMTFLDVHVNRAPVGGRIALQRHFPGGFGSLKKPDTVFANERMTTVIEQGELQVAVIQIASRLVRQIKSFIHEGQDVVLGQRIGVIRFGSQVDLVLPLRPDLKVAVRPGEHVRAGQSVVGVLEPSAVPRAQGPPHG